MFQVQHDGKKDVLLVGDHLNITLISTMNAKLSQQSFWPYHENQAHQDDFNNSPQRTVLMHASGPQNGLSPSR